MFGHAKILIHTSIGGCRSWSWSWSWWWTSITETYENAREFEYRILFPVVWILENSNSYQHRWMPQPEVELKLLSPSLCRYLENTFTNEQYYSFSSSTIEFDCLYHWHSDWMLHHHFQSHYSGHCLENISYYFTMIRQNQFVRYHTIACWWGS